MAGAPRWTLRPLPRDAGHVLLCFPYSGAGASMYRRWPRTLGDHIAVAPLQPPGRESRRAEPSARDHIDFAAQLADWIEQQQLSRYSLFGHCGAATYMCETIFALQDRGAPLPRAMVASGWGAPDGGLYGPLNFVDLDSYDFVQEVKDQAERMGNELPDAVAAAAAELLRADQVIYRGYRYPEGRRIPVPVTVMVWDRDDVVSAEQIRGRWDHLASVRYVELSGPHFRFLDGGADLRRAITDAIAPS